METERRKTLGGPPPGGAGRRPALHAALCQRQTANARPLTGYRRLASMVARSGRANPSDGFSVSRQHAEKLAEYGRCGDQSDPPVLLAESDPTLADGG